MTYLRPSSNRNHSSRKAKIAYGILLLIVLLGFLFNRFAYFVGGPMWATHQAISSKLFSISSQSFDDIASQIKKIADFLTEVNETIAGYLKIVRQIRAMIDYILSLPAKLLAEFQQCLLNLYKSLLAGITASFTDFDGGLTDLKELQDAVSSIGTEIAAVATQAAVLASAPQQLAAAIVTPTSAAEVDAASRSFADYMSTPDLLSSLTPAASSLIASPEATTLVSAAILTSDNAATA